jgi:hypothetical protein
MPNPHWGSEQLLIQVNPGHFMMRNSAVRPCIGGHCDLNPSEENRMKLDDLPLPMYRNAPANSWTPPVGVRIVSSDNHNMEADQPVPRASAGQVERQGTDLTTAIARQNSMHRFQGRRPRSGTPRCGRMTRLPSAEKGSSIPPLQLKDMDAENIRRHHGVPWHVPVIERPRGSSDLYRACVDVYNEWLVEYLKPYSNRMHGIAILPVFPEKPEIGSRLHAEDQATGLQGRADAACTARRALEQQGATSRCGTRSRNRACR